MTDPLLDLANPDQDRRLAALRALVARRQAGPRTGTNTHVHTNHSFSVFASPSAAVWAGVESGIEVLGINDFFTTSGCPEFAAAATIAKLPALFCLECISMDAAAEKAGELFNDPANPGKIYFSGKGIARFSAPVADRLLTAIRAEQERRNRRLVERLDKHFTAVLGMPGPSWDTVVGQTPHGSTTERHVAAACLQHIHDIAGAGSGLRLQDAMAEIFTKIVGVAPVADAPAQQNQIRNQLLKSGKPCYVAEDRAAFPTIADLRAAFLALGGIPVYPVLGNPITACEKSIPALFDRLAAWGVYAIELIPARNNAERVAEVLAECAKRQWPVCDGTEHNTPAMEPMTTTWGMDPRFRPQFRDGACVVLGHQELVKSGKPGYVDAEGQLVPGGFARCLETGRALLAAGAKSAAK